MASRLPCIGNTTPARRPFHQASILLQEQQYQARASSWMAETDEENIDVLITAKNKIKFSYSSALRNQIKPKRTEL